MTLEGDDYSSVLLHVGTNLGRLATFKLLPESDGRYRVDFCGAVSLDDRVIRIAPISANSGAPAYATPHAMGNLRQGIKVNGVIVAVTQSGARIFKPASSKGAHKSWDDFLCDNAAITHLLDRGYALVGLFGDGCVRAYTLPALKEIASTPLNRILDQRRFSDATITSSGDILGWVGPAELALVNVWGQGLTLADKNDDALYNPNMAIPPRPTISNLQWLSGTQYITPADMDLLIAGPDRPPSKRMVAEMRAEERAAYDAERAAKVSDAERAAGAGNDGSSAQGDSYWAQMTKAINERTERLGIMSDNMDRLENNSAGFADDVQKFVAKQKRGMVMGAMKSKFGF